MGVSSGVLVLLGVLCSGAVGSACFCEHYPWSAWSACTHTCNYGTQTRSRTFRYDDYFFKNGCGQLCKHGEVRACNQQSCPINCQLTDFGPWSECLPCAKKQLRTRALQTPAQFGGSDCSSVLVEEQTCHPAEDCSMEPIDCKDTFHCDNGRCISPTLECNTQNDCGDGSDERSCPEPVQPVCPTGNYRHAPGSDLTGNGFDAVAERSRGAVLDNMFMGGSCTLVRQRGSSYRLTYRVPHNLHSFEVKVSVPEDFKMEPGPVHSETIDVPRYRSETQRGSGGSDLDLAFFPVWFLNVGTSDSSSTEVYRRVAEASSKTDSQFFRVHQVLPVSRFQTRESDLYLSQPFLQFLRSLPLVYSHALYRQTFQLFGTHYYSSGTLGGVYDLLYQYSREEIHNSGSTTSETKECLHRESLLNVGLILYSEEESYSKCSNNKLSIKYSGSIMQASQRSVSMTRGGRAGEAGALAWERSGPAPHSSTYQNWAASVIENPAVVDFQLRPIVGLVTGIPCAVTKRRHLRRALMEYLQEFDPCRCAPCPNNARPILSGTECQCVCQTGTYGPHCETRAPDYQSEGVDGSWSCWGSWSGCGPLMKRHRTRQCTNPAPLNGGQPCPGADTQEEGCFASIFPGEAVCISDHDFTAEGRMEGLPPGVEGCPRPPRPAHGFLRKDRRYYSYGEEEEFLCFTGYEPEGHLLILCQPDGTWSPARGQCLRKKCAPPVVPVGMTLFPPRAEYREGETLGFNCEGRGLVPSAPGLSACSQRRGVFRWEPPFPPDLQCISAKPFVPDVRCGRGQRIEGSECVCLSRETCLPYEEEFCILNMEVGAAVMMSYCAFHAGRCHGDRLVFVGAGPCDPGQAGWDWALFRANMSAISSVQQACDADTCYEWETCESHRCVCRAPRSCPKEGRHAFCVKVRGRRLSLTLCSMAALRCKQAIEILNQGECVD